MLTIEPAKSLRNAWEGVRMTTKDRELLDALVHRIRVLSLPQVARTWWPAGRQNEAHRRLQVLSKAGLVHLFRALSHPEIPMCRPAVSWRPNEPPPNFGAVSYRLKARWNRPPLSTLCVIATKKAGRSMGGSGGRFPRESEQTHDLHMAAVFLLHRNSSPENTSYWKSEARILWERSGSKKEKLPDAILDLPEGPRIVEFGGAYSKQKLERFHDYCESIETAYEVW